MNEEIVESIFPGTSQDIKNGICPFCKKPITTFKDMISKQEYEISGLCQQCQDKIFEDVPDDS